MLDGLRKQGLSPGFALDITCTDEDDGTPWDLSIPAKQEKAMAMIRRQKPLFLIGSPCCRAFSAWQALNEAKGDSEAYRLAKAQATEHLVFVCILYREQLEQGRYFLHEHPGSASSWSEETIEQMLQIHGVHRTVGDQCQYGAQVRRGKDVGKPVKKPTAWMSNSEEILRALERRCRGFGGSCSRPTGGSHALCSGTTARDCARYPRKAMQSHTSGNGQAATSRWCDETRLPRSIGRRRRGHR